MENKYPYLTREQRNEQHYQKRADNVKIVYHPVHGKVYVCPFPPSHFSDLQREAKTLILRK